MPVLFFNKSFIKKRFKKLFYFLIISLVIGQSRNQVQWLVVLNNIEHSETKNPASFPVFKKALVVVGLFSFGFLKFLCTPTKIEQKSKQWLQTRSKIWTSRS